MSRGKKILIIGQGIAGTCMAWHALQSGLYVTIIDKGSSNSATAASSGIINPVTGRSYVKSWMIEEFSKSALATYRDMGEEMGEEFIHSMAIYRNLPIIESENTWTARAQDPNYKAYVDPDVIGSDQFSHLRDANRFGHVMGGYRILTKNLIQSFRAKWIGEGLLREEVFNEGELVFSKSQIEYKEQSFDHLVIATGWKGKDSKLFASDAYRPFKGEVYIIRLLNWDLKSIIKYDKFLVPLYGDLYWLGSTSDHQFKDEHPEELKAATLIEYIDNKTDLEYEIVDHVCGIRPATKYRRPFIGNHPQYPNVWLFNGLGTKGISMAPYWSAQILQHITAESLPASVALTEAFEKGIK